MIENKSLQSRYRLERDKISTSESKEFYFAYQIVNYEFHIKEMYVPPEKRGFIGIYFLEIYEYIMKNYPHMLFVVATVIPEIENSEKMLMAMLRHNFKIIKAENNIITLLHEISAFKK
jgi:hypothetical protein